MIRYYSRQGRPIEERDADWSDDNCRVARTRVGDVEVSTVYLVIDHSWGHGNPLIFETLVFGGPLDQEMDRYGTEAQAKAGHEAMVQRVREARIEATR